MQLTQLFMYRDGTISSTEAEGYFILF